MIKKTLIKLILGVLILVIMMAVGFYFFLFLNPFQIHDVNLLKWIPILIGVIGMLFSGMINKNTPVKFLPLLFLPFLIFDLFSFFYVPFIFILITIGVLALVVTRDSVRKLYKLLSILMILSVFFYFLFSQPLVLGTTNYDYDDYGKLINVDTLWDFTTKKTISLPSHILYDINDSEFDLENAKGKTYLITFWATWCPPCMAEKPELEKLKKELEENGEIKFIDISFDSDSNKWKRYIKDTHPMGKQLISKNQKDTRRELQISQIPLHYIVNSEGVYKEYKLFDSAQKALRKLMIEQ